MCDCYSEPCKVCGKFIGIHLADFDTARSEIAVYCKDCSISNMLMQGINFDRCLIWKTKEFGTVLIAYLTEHAWSNREGNHPNTGDAELGNMKAFLKRREKRIKENLINWKKNFERLVKSKNEKQKRNRISKKMV